MNDEPGIGEVTRRLEDVAVELSALRGLPAQIRAEFLPRETYNEARRGDDFRLREAEKDIATKADKTTVADIAKDVDALHQARRDDINKTEAFRRQIIGGVIVGLLLLLASTGVNIAFTLLSRSGS